MTYTPTTTCRLCSGTALAPIFDLGVQPLANAFRRPDDATLERLFPLGLLLCRDCALVQLKGIVDPHEMFDDYPYFSSYSTTMVDAMRQLAGQVVAGLEQPGSSLVVDIGSNDGYLLHHYRDLGVRVLGIDPARNVTETALSSGIPTLVSYFSAAAAVEARVAHGPADVIHANNVMAHVPDINDFTAGLTHLLADDGTAFVESPYVADLVGASEFDTVYHEHVFHYSATAMDALLQRHDLAIADVEHLAIHGGTLRYTVRHSPAVGTPAVREVLERESAEGIADVVYYRRLGDHVRRLRTEIRGLLADLKAGGALIAGYGAAAKGTVLLNHFGIDTTLVDFVVDRNPHKHGLLMPGVQIPIVDPARLHREPRPSHVLVLAWNLLDEVLYQQDHYRRNGGSFIVPIPELRIIDP